MSGVVVGKESNSSNPLRIGRSDFARLMRSIALPRCTNDVASKDSVEAVVATEYNAVSLARAGRWRDVMRLKNPERLVDPDKCTLLHVAASSGNVRALKTLLSIEGIRTDATDVSGHTALGFAAASGHLDGSNY